MKQANPAQPLPRDEYGALDTASSLTPPLRKDAQAFIADSVKANLLPAPYQTFSKREYECLNLDIYDVLVFRGRVKGLIIQARTFWRDTRKGYTRSTKTYYLVLKAKRKLTASVIENNTCSKRAKNTTALGQLVNHYMGKIEVKCKKPLVPISWAYKVLAKDPDGRLLSAFDDSEYKIGKWRQEAVADDHGGGFYYYDDQELAIAATERGQTFSDSVSAGKQLVLCLVEVSGRTVEYNDGKKASSRLRVMQELQAVVLGSGAE
ncbi:hypothetical protein LNV09_14660 [Paucibacter sp. B2R-40]|uniref:hypothetical protein n=1 Tax=Paucibacter sp. B2R-40 TaxID=2893554 RepID=UPI0021E3CC97|nr:hypothetical protein [Paucibacter sp. B2R-40]MCV2355393.1 hypothetical protein [Paucibacter sp. B2R-40]